MGGRVVYLLFGEKIEEESGCAGVYIDKVRGAVEGGGSGWRVGGE